ncbi:acetone carboxylase subunit gamma [Haloarchaeobius salinus]|uniref:acetone carboxylase subunit gamma n=1 Tax=Haloarchaeobius salinus TaxID=1198298 RepID=UPI002108BF51
MPTTLDTHLEAADGRLRCRSCGEDICSVDAVYKEHLLCAKKPLTEANPLIDEPGIYVDEEFELREYYCPGCATLVEAQMMQSDRDILADKELATDH